MTSLDRDIRSTDRYREAEALYTALLEPGTNVVSDAADLDTAPDGRHAAFTARVHADRRDAPSTRIATIDVGSGEIEPLTAGPHDRAPRIIDWSTRHLGT